MKNIILVLCLVSSFSCNKSTSEKINIPTELIKNPQNIILMIGDGMGLGQITAGMYANGGETNFSKFKTIGLHKNNAYDKLVTDSAAGATSFASGIKTYNGAIGVDQDTMAVQTILEEAESRGLRTGLIATSTIVHATPAAFVAHNKSRKNYYEIAADFMNVDLDIFIGGGSKYFNQREDGRNLYTELKNRNYQLDDYLGQELEDIVIDPKKNFAYLTAIDSPLPYGQGRTYLMEATRKTLNHLSSDPTKGFFLMIEGSQIDWGGHANNADYLISEQIEFDQIVGYVVDWAREHNTLVIVTADHETGGFAIQQESTADSLVTAFTSDYHTGTMIPVFADGPQSTLFNGIYENTSIYGKMRAAFGWKVK